jgi:Flp pilus assembly protein TadD
LGVAFFRSNNLSGARVEFEKSLSLKTNSPAVDWYFLAMINHVEGKSTEAKEYLQKAKQFRLENRPNDAEYKELETEASDCLPSDVSYR